MSECQSQMLKHPFWQEKNGNVLPLKNEDVVTYFAKFLPSLGFFKIPGKRGDGFIPVQIKGRFVRRVDENDIREFIVYLMNQDPLGNAVLDQMTLQHQKFFGSNIKTSLRVKSDLKTLKDTRITAYRFFRNCVVEVNGESVRAIDYDKLDSDIFIFIDKILGRDFVLDQLIDEDSFLSDVTCHKGKHFYRWCQNLCRFREDNDWIFNQRSFKSLASGFGYLLHKSWNEQKIVVFTDKDMISGVSNGRTGKSVVLNDALENAVNTVIVNAKSISRFNSDRFLFSEVDHDTEYVCFDDGTADFPLESLFSTITGNLAVERKHANKFTIHKNDKPKMALSCNHPILGEGFSFEDRQHLVEVSDYYRYHKQEEYLDPVKIHGGYLFDEDWGTRNWQEFDTFCIYALRYYLKHGLVGGKASSEYRTTKLHNEIGSAELANALHRLIEENVNSIVYREKIDGFADEVALLDSVRSQLTTDYPDQHIVSSFKKVANHFGYRINEGQGKRIQKRFGSGLVDGYRITHSSNPFPKVMDDQEGH
ncbi:MAG: primase-helicase family protein [Candidatus Andersenbacteria bacterium]